MSAKKVPKLPKNVPEMPECHEGSANMCQQRQKYTKRCHERAQRAKDVPKGAEYEQTAQKCHNITFKIIFNMIDRKNNLTDSMGWVAKNVVFENPLVLNQMLTPTHRVGACGKVKTCVFIFVYIFGTLGAFGHSGTLLGTLGHCWHIMAHCWHIVARCDTLLERCWRFWHCHCALLALLALLGTFFI
jgi:hypothetical protein